MWSSLALPATVALFAFSQHSLAAPQIRASNVTTSLPSEISSGTTLPAISTTQATTTTTTPTNTDVSTAIPSPTAPLNATLPTQAALPPVQAWCPGEIFCAGPLLQAINIAQLYPDSKTFVDKPTVGTVNKTLTDFSALFPAGTVQNSPNSTSALTYGELANFASVDFKGEGLELIPVPLSSTNGNGANSTGLTIPPFLQSNTTVPNELLRAWANIVHGYWNDLIRETNTSALCDGITCESTLIPLNHTFVVPGGRFREQYYWDSYWIVEGLIQSELFGIVNSTLQNFMDELESIGFIPNGGRTYYLNRSQPPLFMKMLYSYVNATKDVSILDRALPLAEVELQWWYNNRTVNVTSPYTNQTWEVSRYAVVNTAPRPEGYLEDYLVANGPDLTTPYTEEQKADLYAELASGAESGLDYSSRWLSNPYAGNETDQSPLLRTLNIRNTIPVDLNSILYKYRSLLADLYELRGNGTSLNPNPSNSTIPTNVTVPTNGTAPPGSNSSDASRAVYHRQKAATLRAAILDLFWSNDTLAFYDFNLTSSSRTQYLTPASFYPYWSDIIPDVVRLDEDKAIQAYSAVRLVLARYNGTFPASFISTGLQWDAPNAWPPHQFIILEGLQNFPALVKTKALPSLDPANNVTSYSLVPVGQLGFNETDLPLQPLDAGGFANGDLNEIDGGGSTGGNGTLVNGNGTTVTNGGNATDGETWDQTLTRELANRYIASMFCSWYATGGSIPGLLEQLPPDELNVTFSLNNTGKMFEKLSAFDIDVAGGGGEYTVQAGFGWSNGVVLWLASNYGGILAAPNCPTIQINTTVPLGPTNSTVDSNRSWKAGKRAKYVGRRTRLPRSN